MKGREGRGPPAADLLVCFPSRAHLTLMPKPICSPARPSEPATRHRQHHHPLHHHHHHHHHHPRKSSIRAGGGGGPDHPNPILWAKPKAKSSDISEPTSPKVNCAGQIKVRPKASSCKNWQSVMEEIERLHKNRKEKKRHAWIPEGLGFKKDAIQFLTCLRNIRFDFRCFGSFPTDGITSDDEEEDDDDEEDGDQNGTSGSREQQSYEKDEKSRNVLSKWFMILEEKQGKEFIVQEENKEKMIRPHSNEGLAGYDGDDGRGSCVPPPNALMLMRCRSTPAKTWIEEKEEEEEREREKESERKESLIVMRCGEDYSKFSCDIAKETWVVGGIKDMLSRSRSWKI